MFLKDTAEFAEGVRKAILEGWEIKFMRERSLLVL